MKRLVFIAIVGAALLVGNTAYAQFTGGSGDGHAMDEASVTFTGLSESATATAISIQPNPAANGQQCTLMLPSHSSETQCMLFNVHGNIVWSSRVAGDTRRVSLPTDLASGTYILNVQTELDVQSLQLIVL